MTLFRNIVRASDNFLSTKRCFVFNKNKWNVENYFSNKVELPSPPKRPLTAYMIFCKEKRKDLVKASPYLRTPEQIKVLAEKWSHLTEDMKKPYELSARENTQLYGEEHKKFYESLSEEQKEELARLKAEKKESRRILKNKRILRDSGIPKAPNTAYALFVHSESSKRPSETHPSEFIKKVAELWKSLPEDSKKVFEEKAEEDKVRFSKEMKEWRSKMLAEDNKKVLKAYEELKGKDLESGESKKKEKKSSKK